MTASNDKRRAAVLGLVRKGLLTPDEAADLTYAEGPGGILGATRGHRQRDRSGSLSNEDMALSIDGRAAKK
jgi:hypothetical protein